MVFHLDGETFQTLAYEALPEREQMLDQQGRAAAGIQDGPAKRHARLLDQLYR